MIIKIFYLKNTILIKTDKKLIKTKKAKKKMIKIIKKL